MIENIEIEKFGRLLLRRTKNDWDIVIAITGEEGSGKSSFGIQLGKAIDKNFNLIRNVAYLPDEKQIKEQFNYLRSYSAYLIDEAISVFHKHMWMSSLQQMLIRMYATERSQNKTTMLCIPRFRDLTENFRNHRVKIWIHIISRGHAIAFAKDQDKDSLDPWHIDESIKKKNKWFGSKQIKDRSIADYLKFERRAVNYMCDFEFDDLDGETKVEYRRLKAEAKLKYRPLETGKVKVHELRWRKAAGHLGYVLNQIGISHLELANLSGMSDASIRNSMNSAINPHPKEIHKHILIKLREKSEKIFQKGLQSTKGNLSDRENNTRLKDVAKTKRTPGRTSSNDWGSSGEDRSDNKP